MVIKAIIFDADGVIIKSRKFSTQFSKEYGIEEKDMLPFFQGIFQDCVRGEKDLKEVIVPYLKEWNYPGSAEEFTQFWFKISSETNNELLEVIKELKKLDIKCVIGTNQEKYRTNYIRKDMEMNKIFNDVFSSAMLKSLKPNKEFYEGIYLELTNMMCCGKTINKEDIMFFDDSQSNVDGGNDFGFKSYLFTDNEQFLKDIKKEIPEFNPKI